MHPKRSAPSSSNGDKASASDHDGQASAKRGPARSRQHVPERGAKEPIATKHPPGVPPMAKHPPGKSEDALRQSIRRGNDQDTLGSKASAREETNDNGRKASANENKDGQASILRERMVAKYLRKPNDGDKVKHCRIARIQPIFWSVHFFGPYPSD